MTERTNELLAQLVELQGRQIGVLEAQLENQRIALERQQSILRRSFPLLVVVMVLSTDHTCSNGPGISCSVDRSRGLTRP